MPKCRAWFWLSNGFEILHTECVHCLCLFLCRRLCLLSVLSMQEMSLYHHRKLFWTLSVCLFSIMHTFAGMELFVYYIKSTILNIHDKSV